LPGLQRRIQQAALIGQMCTKPEMVKNTYGTGCFMLMNIGESLLYQKYLLNHKSLGKSMVKN